jgi:excinuclease ABC subunit B
VSEPIAEYRSFDDLDEMIKDLEAEMKQAAKKLAFEKAAALRDQILELKKLQVFEF